MGLTIGDLYDCAEKLMGEHRWCPHAHPGQLGEDGIVNVDVRFSGRMVVQADDPTYLKARAEQESSEAYHQQRTIQNAKLQVYCNTKR